MLDKNNLPKFEPGSYHKIALNDLLVYSIHHFQHDGVEISSEDVISACFLLFPKRFSLRNYPHWPDSAVVSRRWNECHSKGYIVGSAPDGFKLTSRGIKFAERVAKKLGVAKPKPSQFKKVHPSRKSIKTQAIHPDIKHPSRLLKDAKKVASGRTGKAITSIRVNKSRPSRIPSKKTEKAHQPIAVVKEKTKQAEKVLPAPVSVPREVKIRAGKFVRAMETSDAYIHFKKNGKNSKIGEFDFRSLLLCTMESSRDTLIKNVELFKGYAKIHNRQDLIIFLGHCEDRFSYLLAAPQKQLKKSIRKSTK